MRRILAARDPILIRCEGSGAKSEYCPMCASATTDETGDIVEHDRLDILAMIDRGDFDPVKHP